VAVIVFKLAQALMAAWVHANLKLPLALDRHLRRAVVTPDMHRVHHSSVVRETNSNYGGITPIRDHLFGTCVAQPRAGHEHMDMGLLGMQSVESVKLHRMLLQPFR
jgi:sterol desaturase/sphingolipid hydroxylase (fatty acid hydroxylase superfamily)